MRRDRSKRRHHAPDCGTLERIMEQIRRGTLVVTLPDTAHARVVNKQYQAQMRPNGRLAGLLRKGEEDDRHLVPFVFAEVRLPRGKPGMRPVLSSRLPSKHWVFCWDERRRTGYLLLVPRPRDEQELRFHIAWQGAEIDVFQAQ